MAEPWLLAVDLGTGGPKVAAVSAGGEILAHAARRVDTCYTPDGGATQDPETWWAGIRGAVEEILHAGVDGAEVTGVGITGQWGSTVPVDAAGRAAGPCLLWADTRGGKYSAPVIGGRLSVMGYGPGNLLRWMRLTGGAPSPHGADPTGHALQLQREHPEVYARTATLMEPLDYLGLRFTGRRAATPASMILSWLTDNRPGRPPAYAATLVRHARRDAARLPELVPTGTVLGDVLPEVAAELGLRPVPVVAGLPDLHTGYVGSGATAPLAGHVAISSTAWIGCAVPFKRTDLIHQLASVPGARPGEYLVANNHETAGLCLQWLRDNVLGGGEDYATLTSVAAAAPAGAGGVMFTPWLNGERSPVDDRNLRAAFLNLSLTTDRSSLVRAVMEGVAFNARWLLDAVEKFIRRPMPVLRILGGGAESALWCQAHADILNRRVEQVSEPTLANLRGAALYAASALGQVAFDDIARLIPVAAVYEPDPANRSTYESMYREYARVYGRLRPIYARLNGR